MNEKKLKLLLRQLNDELEQTSSVDTDTVSLLKDLEDDVQRLLDAGAEAPEYESALNQAQALEARFAVEHPKAERFLREIMDLLAKVGI